VLTLHHLDPSSVWPFVLLVKPALRQRLLHWHEEANLVVLGASFGRQPMGAAVALRGDEAAHLLDLYILPGYRSSGFGTALLAEAETHIAQTGLARIQARYDQNEHTPAFESVLAKRGWVRPTVTHRVFATTREQAIINSRWVQRYRFRPPYQAVPWSDVCEADRQAIAERGKRGWYPSHRSPLQRPTDTWDSETSLALRYKGEVVGWALTIREAPDQLLVDILFVDPPLQRLGKGFMLIGEVIRRCWQVGIEYTYWQVRPDNKAMLRWSRRAFDGALADEYDERYSEKNLAHPIPPTD